MKESLVRRARTINAGDAPKAAEFITRSTPVPDRLAQLLPGLLQQLIAEEILSGVVIEHIRDGEARPELAAVGLSGFVSETWADGFLASPAPHIELVLLDLASRDTQGPAFLTHRRDRAGQRGGQPHACSAALAAGDGRLRRPRGARSVAAWPAEFPGQAPGLPADPHRKGNVGGKGLRLPGRRLPGALPHSGGHAVELQPRERRSDAITSSSR